MDVCSFVFVMRSHVCQNLRATLKREWSIQGEEEGTEKANKQEEEGGEEGSSWASFLLFVVACVLARLVCFSLQRWYFCIPHGEKESG